MVLAIFTDIVLRLRAPYRPAMQVTWAVGMVTAPVIGGACAHPKTWRWIFYINFPICATLFGGGSVAESTGRAFWDNDEGFIFIQVASA